jgi:hypothetical protein
MCYGAFMTVAELIDKLQTLPGDWKVVCRDGHDAERELATDIDAQWPEVQKVSGPSGVQAGEGYVEII